MHLPPLIQDLAVILGVGALVTYIFRKIRQPVVLGYIIAGLIVGPHTPPFGFVSDIPNIKTWAELGVIFLMFTLGLEFSFRKLSRVGSSVAITGIWQVIAMIGLGYGAGRVLGWHRFDSLFLGAMIAISSTTIIVKALDELGLKTRRFAELVFGMLIVEDLVAILILVLLSSLVQEDTLSVAGLVGTGLRMVLVVGSWMLVGYFVIPRFVKSVGRLRSDEMLTVLSVGLCLLLVSVAVHFHYSAALGAFIMGSILAETREAHRIEHLVRPLRDIFAAVFFVSVGMLVDPRVLLEQGGPILLISLVVVIGKILALVAGMLATGQSWKRSVQVGFSMAQIGEFSFIIASLGEDLKVTSPALNPTIVAVSLITTFTTPYLIRLSEAVSARMERRLPVFIQTRIQGRSSSVVGVGASEAQLVWNRAALSWLACAIVIAVVFQLASHFLLPALLASGFAPEGAGAMAWLAAVVLVAPFMGALFSLLNALRRRSVDPVSRLGYRIGIVFSFVGLIALSQPFLSNSLQMGVALALALLLFIVFRVKLKLLFDWFERQFLVTFEEADQAAEESSSPEEKLKHLAPWDAHLVRMQVNPLSPLIEKNLSEARLRERFGLNVVAIQRGGRVQVAPTRTDRLLPYDVILCLGTDEQIDRVRPLIESDGTLDRPVDDLGIYELQKCRVGEASFVAHKTILQSGLRDAYKVLIVGIERGPERIVNPQSDAAILPGDALWIVGDSVDIKAFVHRMENPEIVEPS